MEMIVLFTKGLGERRSCDRYAPRVTRSGVLQSKKQAVSLREFSAMSTTKSESLRFLFLC